MSQPFPMITVLVVGAALLVAMFPSATDWLVYDRDAIRTGQIWRMFTGHWVHLSTQHLLLDVAGFGVAGWIIESQRLSRFGWLCALTPWLISLTLLQVEPQMIRYAGLSGLATAAVVYLAVWGLTGKTPWRRVCVFVLVALAGKLIFEWSAQNSVFLAETNPSVKVSTVSHVAGATSALMIYCWARSRRARTIEAR